MPSDETRSTRLPRGGSGPAAGRIAVELAGYLDTVVGVGEAARRYVLALRSAGVAVVERNVVLTDREPAGAQVVDAPRPSRRAVGFNVLCLNPPEMLAYLAGPDAPPSRRRLQIAHWAWEVDMLPESWSQAAREVAEVWTNSSFVAQRMRSAIDVPVYVFPSPLHRDWRTLPARPAGGVGRFRVLTMFDYLSTIERKNPLGAIEAYRRAFGPGDGCELFLKSVNGRHRADRRAEVEAAAEGRPDIVLCDRAVSAQERDELVATCDVYLSLHRSEGFGLTLAEAMAACKPVVATAFGGNTDFMTAANSYLVGYEPRLVGDGVEHYPAGATWAEPDVAQAAIQLRAVFDDRMRAQARAERGRSDVEAMLAPQVVGASMRDHLEALQDAGASHRTRPLARWSRVR